MKRVYLALALLTIVAVLCAAEYLSIQNVADKYTEGIEYIETSVHKGDFDTARKIAAQMKKEWKRTVRHVDMLVYHDYADEIGNNISQLQIYIDAKDETALLSVCESAKRELRSLIDSEVPVAENII